MSDCCVALVVQPRKDYKVLYMRVRRKIHVLRSALFRRRALQSGGPDRQEEPFLVLLSLLATCQRPCQELVRYRGLLDTLSENELRVLRVLFVHERPRERQPPQLRSRQPPQLRLWPVGVHGSPIGVPSSVLLRRLFEL